MTTLPPPAVARSRLQYEAGLLVENIRRVRDHYLNLTFDLSLVGARGRKRTLIILFVGAGFFVALFTHPITDWWIALRNLFVWALNPLIRQTFTSNPVSDLIVLAVGSVANLFRYFAILVFPYWAAVHAASLYLSDIFEKPAWIARSFLGQVALGGKGEMIEIQDGEFLDKEVSRIYAIGGPGYVNVDRNSAALFEKPDGRPHVIGPTISGAVMLDGFERFRSVIDLRDQHIDMRDQPNSDVTSRSLDGIPVSAVDVSMRFSVWRGHEKLRSLAEPNPFKDDQVIEDLVYGQGLLVEKKPRPKDTPPDVPSPVGASASGLIRSELARFMSERRLSEFLSSIGEPEVEAARQRNRAILETSRQVIPPGDPDPEISSPGEVPQFTPRSDISTRFNEGFTRDAHRRGLQLDWIGVGTWKTPPTSKIPAYHVEAWELSLENEARGSAKAIDRVLREAQHIKTIQIVQTAPLARHQENMLQRDMKHSLAIKRLLISYFEQLREARELLRVKGESDQSERVNNLEDAIDYVFHLLSWDPNSYHSAGRSDDREDPIRFL